MRPFLFFFVLVPLICLSSTITAKAGMPGRVVDENGAPIANVTITSTDINKITRTDDKGNFTIIPTTQKSFTLTFSHAGYIPKSIKIHSAQDSIVVTLVQQIYPMQGITVTSGRAVAGQSPVAFANLDKKKIERDFDIGEFPELLESTPNLYSYSDAGGGLGYSYMSIRGFNARRSPVYINGVPLNDPEDHALYFVDLPDFASHVDNIQVQRGVGNSLYGDPSFGGSVNILTSVFSHSQQAEIETGYGGFLQGSKTVGLMRKNSAYFSTGLLNGGWSLTGRWVTQYSDGYRKHSWYDGNAFYLSIGRIDPKMITTVNIYGGPMKTHAAWDGITRETEKIDRRTNWYSYSNETDNFSQPHFELHNIYNLTDRLTFDNTFYVIHGKGFYEQLKHGQDLVGYNLPDTTSDLIRRKWVTKNQYGFNSHLDYGGKTRQASVGGSYYYFESKHWGEVLWAEALTPSNRNIGNPDKYYEYFGTYHDMSAYVSYRQLLGDRLSVTANLQLRYLHKNIHMTPIGVYPVTIYSLDWMFLSPRIGFNYALSQQVSSYFSFSISSHEPNDDMIDDADNPNDIPQLEVIDSTTTPIVYGDALVGAERLYDFELGTSYKGRSCAASVNLFWMEYRNALVPDGQLNDDGQPTYGNAHRSVHRGVELSATYNVNSLLTISGNYSFNDFWVKSYDQYNWDGTVTKYRDVATPNFPTYLANLSIDYTYKPARFIYRLRAVGRQFISYDGRYVSVDGKSMDISIAPHMVSSIKGILDIGPLLGGAKLVLEGRVDNLFDKKYETYGYKWGADYFAYWPAAERNWFVNVKLRI